jgi:3-hydroxyisobutyrate dehydrogenase
MTAEQGEAGPGTVVGFIGLGNMGIPMTGHLVAAGYHVRGFDTTTSAMENFAAIGASDAGGAATPVTDLASVGNGADAVILMLPDSDIVERVVLGRLAGETAPADGSNGGLLASLPPGSTIIDMSSSDPARTRVLAEQVAGAGVTLIDAPVSGGVAGARAATLMIMVGGPSEAFGRFEPMLGTLGKRVVHAGDTGAGHAVKALNNLMSAAHLLASSEALIAGRRFGLDPAVMLEIVNGASGRSGSTENKWPNYVLTEKFDAGFSIRLMVKDLRLALSIEHATGVPAAASEAVVATWESALAALPPDADHTAIARWLSTQSR